jgi:hypothetical protein
VANFSHSVLMLIIGAIVFIVFSFVMPASKAQLSELDELALRQQWNSVVGSNYSPKEWLQIKQDAKDQQILHLEAISLGLHKTDAVVRQRLKQLSEYLDESDLINFEYSDEIIRRRLIQLMEEKIIDQSDITIDDEDIANYYHLNSEKYFSPPKLSFKHIFFASLDKSKNEWEKYRNATKMKGEAFLAGNDFVKVTESSVNRFFGSGFFTKLNINVLNQWQGPIESSFGYHWVILHDFFPPQPSTLTAQRLHIKASLFEMRRKEALTVKLIEFRDNYQNGWVISPYSQANSS